MPVTIGLCMIVRNEEENLPRCLNSVRGLVEETVIVDTGSTDNTIAVAKERGADVYYYQWDNSFANARNFALSKAKSEWVLLLDADEALDQASVETVRNFVNTTDKDGAHFCVRNYTGAYSADSYSQHVVLRLLRNTGAYYYVNDIHEQIASYAQTDLSDRFAVLNAIVHHYGYLEQVVAKKQKRERNFALLEKQLEQYPENSFFLFNMGNELMALRKEEQALLHYQKALSCVQNKQLAFVPHLYFRMAHCLERLQLPAKALAAVEEGLALFPSCTDFCYLRGEYCYQLGRFTLAIRSFEICLKMGNPPAMLAFMPGCGTYRAACRMAEVFFELEDYSQALYWYEKALSFKGDFYLALYRAGAALKNLSSPQEAAKQLFAHFSDPAFINNVLVGADILLAEGLVLQAEEVLRPFAKNTPELCSLQGRAYFYRHDFAQAKPLLKAALEQQEKVVLRNARQNAARALFALELAENQPCKALAVLQECNPAEGRAAALMAELGAGRTPPEQEFSNQGREELAGALGILEQLLRCREFDLFERQLQVLNYMEHPQVLLGLSRLYQRAGFPQLAAQTALRSMQKNNWLDVSSALLLLRHPGTVSEG